MRRIAVGVYDDDEIFRRGVMACLCDDALLSVVSAGPATHTATADAAGVEVGVVAPAVLDRWRPRCPVVVCAGGGAGGLVPKAAAGVVMAVLSRQSVVPDQLVNAVRAAAVGLRIADTDRTSSSLDDRSVQVLRLLADGADTREISGNLGWSERTIKGVIADIQVHLGARSRTQAVAVALRQQVI